MTPQAKAALRSAVTTFVVSFLAFVPATFAGDDFTWLSAALWGAGVATARTAVVWLDPKAPAYGRGSVEP